MRICGEKYLYGIFSGIPIIAPDQGAYERVCRLIKILDGTRFGNFVRRTRLLIFIARWPRRLEYGAMHYRGDLSRRPVFMSIPDKLILDQDAWDASVIVHEAEHAFQIKRKGEYKDMEEYAENERDAMKMQKKFLSELGAKKELRYINKLLNEKINYWGDEIKDLWNARERKCRTLYSTLKKKRGIV